MTSEYVDLEKQASFVSTYKGKTVEFDCIVYYMENNPKYKTIYSYMTSKIKAFAKTFNIQQFLNTSKYLIV